MKKISLIVIYDIGDFIAAPDDKILEILNTMNNKKNFDYILSNPPYDRQIHLKFLKKLIEISNNVISIQPINWLQDLNTRNNPSSAYNIYENTISKYIYDIEIINSLDAKKIFNGIQCPDLGIYICNNIGGFDYQHKFENTIMNKVITYINNNTIISEYSKNNGWRVRIPKAISFGGGSGTNRAPLLHNLGKLLYFYNGKKENKWWYEYYMKNQNTKTTEEITRSIYFNSEIEAKNFCSSFNLPLVRYIENLLITDMGILDNRILWLGNAINPRTQEKGYLTEWNNNDIEKIFNITNNEKEMYINFLNNYKNNILEWYRDNNKKIPKEI